MSDDDRFEAVRDGDDDPLEDRSKDEDQNGEAGDDGPGIGEKIEDALAGAGNDAPAAAARVSETLTSTAAKKVYFAAAVLAVAVGLFAWAVASRGVINAVVYAILFVFAATVFPFGINLLGGATPNSIGKLHLLLGAIAFDHHYLVQRDNGWEWCPGERGRVWIDDEWHELEGEENYSVLGWRPFGILRYKDDETWSQERADTAGLNMRPSAARERDPTADGGTPVAERGGVKEIERPAISGLDGTWLLDLKRIMTNGVRKIGDVELIETAEEIIERNQVDDSRMGSAGPLVESIIGVLLGIIAGYGYIFLSG